MGLLTPDSSGYNNPGRFVGSSLPSLVPSPWIGFDNALDFTVEDAVSSVDMGTTVPYAGGTGAAGAFTLEAKVNMAAYSQLVDLSCIAGLSSADGPQTTQFLLLLFASEPDPLPASSAYFSGVAGYVTPGGSNFQEVDCPSYLALNTNYDVAMDYDGTTLRLYVDGTVVASGALSGVTIPGSLQTPTFMVSNNQVAIEADQAEHFQGVIDEVRFSNIARYAGTNYTPATTPFTSDAHTLGLWHMDSIMTPPSAFLQLEGVLNVLAFGSYPNPSSLDAAGAANVWAGITNRANWLSLLGALNYKNGWRSGGTKPYLGLNAVCAQLAGTSPNNEALYSLNKLAGTL